MSTLIKLSEFELSELSRMKDDRETQVYRLGALCDEQETLVRTIEDTKQQLQVLRQQESEFRHKLWTQYGNGYVDLQQGVFVAEATQE